MLLKIFNFFHVLDVYEFFQNVSRTHSLTKQQYNSDKRISV